MKMYKMYKIKRLFNTNIKYRFRKSGKDAILTAITRIAVLPLRLPGHRSNPSSGFGVNGVDAHAPRDPPVRLRRGVLAGDRDTGKLLVKGVQLGRNVLTDEGVENNFEQRPVPEHPDQPHSCPTDVRARLLGSYRHLEDVGVAFVGGLPFG